MSGDLTPHARRESGLPGRPITNDVVADLARALALAPGTVLLIDGPSGAGKSTLASAVSALVTNVEIVHTDDLAPGWDGLAAASALVPEVIAGCAYHVWDWYADAPGSLRQRDRSRSLIVEGCGAITPSSAAAASRSVWVDADDAIRQARALSRETSYAAHWDQWAAQEREHWRRHQPWLLSDLILNG